MLARWTLSKLHLTLALAIFAWALIGGGCVFLGSGDVLPSRAVFEIRLERVLLASLVGAALAGAGVLFQATLRNALAEPFLLGVAGGAGLGGYVWKLPVIAAQIATLHPLLASASQQSFVFAGAVLASLIVLLLGLRGRMDSIVLILAGVIVNSIAAAIILTLHSLYRGLAGQGGLDAVLIGELQTNLSPMQLYTSSAIVLACLLVSLLLTRSLNATLLSDDEAKSLGVSLGRQRLMTLSLASLMTAAAVAVSGPIGFIGLIAPHIARRIVGHDHRRLLPWSIALGASLLCIADGLTRFLAGTGRLNQHLPVGVVTALLGGPFFLLLLLSHQRGARR